jgi:O-antigen/teichoic acid export membrane protein
LNDIDKKIAKGAAWMVSFKLIDRGLGLLSTVILARLLIPADFGLVAMATVLIGALQLLVSFSFDVPLIQNPNTGREQFDTAWTLNVLFAALCGLILAALAIPASQFYREPRLDTVMYLLALGFTAQGFSNIGPVIFRREMRFDLEFKFLLGKRLTSLLVTVPLAFLLKNYWALVYGQLFGSVASVALSFVVSSYRPRFSLRAKTELFHSSKWLVLNNIFQFLNGRAAELLIGRSAGAQTLGVYAIAAEVATLPTTELVAPINRAAFPGYTQSAGDINKLRASFLNVISTSALFALPAGIGIAVVADLLVPAALGWKWLAAIPLIQLLAVYGALQALQTNIGYVYLALGEPRVIAIINGVQFLFLLMFLIPGIHYWGAFGAASAFLGSVVLIVPVNQIFIRKRLALNGLQLCAHLVRPLIASVIMGCVVLILKANLDIPPETSAYLSALIFAVPVGALTYVFVLYGLWRLASQPAGSERFCFSQIENALRRFGINVNLVGCH